MKKEERLVIPVSREDKEKIEKAANSLGLNTATYARILILKGIEKEEI